MTFEEAMQRLNEITSQMEKGDLPLEQSIKLYEEGTKLAVNCRKQLEEAQLKITTLQSGTEQNIDGTTNDK
ncbi:MAG TPA: exodeoxyribonuclease VII small subunit [Oscillospiraceae bacterium]|nr:exodeoxyribonuclease VII small subunit [Oscillospiraceae bacterium]